MVKRNRAKQISTLEQRLQNAAAEARQAAKSLPPGAEREEQIRKARQAEVAAHLNKWISSPGLRPPE